MSLCQCIIIQIFIFFRQKKKYIKKEIETRGTLDLTQVKPKTGIHLYKSDQVDQS